VKPGVFGCLKISPTSPLRWPQNSPKIIGQMIPEFLTSHLRQLGGLLGDGSTLPLVVTLWRNRTTTISPMAYPFDYTFTAFSVPKHYKIGICLHFKHRTFCRVVRDRLSGGGQIVRDNLSGGGQIVGW
jgi:hypothetical protein